MIDEASTIYRKLLELMDINLKYLGCNCSSMEADKPRFGVVSIVLCEDYLGALPSGPSRKWLEKMMEKSYTSQIACSMNNHWHRRLWNRRNFAKLWNKMENSRPTISRIPPFCFYRLLFESTHVSVALYS